MDFDDIRKAASKTSLDPNRHFLGSFEGLLEALETIDQNYSKLKLFSSYRSMVFADGVIFGNDEYLKVEVKQKHVDYDRGGNKTYGWFATVKWDGKERSFGLSKYGTHGTALKELAGTIVAIVEQKGLKPIRPIMGQPSFFQDKKND